MAIEQSAFDKIREQARKNVSARVTGQEKDKPVKKAPEPEVEETTSEGEDNTEEESEETETTEEASEESETQESTEEDDGTVSLDEIKSLLLSGKLKKLATKLGLDPDKADIHPAKLRRLRNLETAIEVKQKELDTNTSKYETDRLNLDRQITQNSAKTSVVDQIVKAARTEDWGDVARNIERCLPTGITFGQLTQLVLQSNKPATPMELSLQRQLADFRREQREAAEKETKEKNTNTASQQHTENISYVKKQLVKHPVTAIDGYEELVLKGMSDCYNKSLGTWSRTLGEVATTIYKNETARASKILKVPVKKVLKKKKVVTRSNNGRFVIPQPKTNKVNDIREAAARRVRARVESKHRGNAR